MNPKVHRLIKEISKLKEEEVLEVAKTIVDKRLVDIGPLLVVYIQGLQNNYDNARRDVHKVAEAGAALADKTLREQTGLGGRSAKLADSLKLGLVRCLLEAGAYYKTEYGDGLRNSINISSMDEDWYQWAWRPKDRVYPIKPNHEGSE